MRAMVADGRGSVRLGQADEPVPAASEAVIAVEAYSVNRGETFQLEAPPPAWRPGKDIAGTVVSAAADGSGPTVGTRVVGHPGGFGWAERAVVPTSGVAVLPDNVATTTAAALPLAGLTALRLLGRAGSLTGRRLLITGASGGVGHFVVELACAAGADVTAVTATAERGELLRRFGAHTVRDVGEAQGWFDLAMESVGGASFTAVRARVVPHGEVIWFGQAGRQPITVDFFDWIDGTAGARITPFHYVHSERSDGEDLATLLRLVASDRLHPVIGTVTTWRETARVVDDLRRRRLRGNAVLTVD